MPKVSHQVLRSRQAVNSKLESCRAASQILNSTYCAVPNLEHSLPIKLNVGDKSVNVPGYYLRISHPLHTPYMAVCATLMRSSPTFEGLN